MRFRCSVSPIPVPAVVLLACAAALTSACERVPTSENAPTLSTHTVAPAPAVRFIDNATEPFGIFRGVTYVRHTGLFEGVTSLGAFRMPYEIIVPKDPRKGNRTLLVEPPHFLFGPLGRDIVLGHDVLFGHGFSYGAVGYGDDLLTILDPTASGLVLAGAPVASPGAPSPAPTLDEEILIQFSEAFATEPFAVTIVGSVNRLYAYGISQTSDILLELQRRAVGTPSEELFDLTILHIAHWLPPFRPPGVVEFLDGDFEPIEGVGRILFVESENDLIVSQAQQFRRAVGVPGYRVYEVAGAAHQPSPTNPLDHLAVTRALFVAGDAWVRHGIEPPPSTLIAAAPAGQIDPVYGFETGIARDGDRNAQGGVRLPDLAVGRAQFIASDPAAAPPLPPELAALAVLFGSMVDLACDRFASHGDYVQEFARATNALRAAGFLLDKDAFEMKVAAAQSDVATPEACGG